MLDFLYNTTNGRRILKVLINPSVSRAVGVFMDSKASRILIPPFVKLNHIDLSNYYSDDFTCFNDCFTRKIRQGHRPISKKKNALIAPCDGYLSVYELSKDSVIPVKQSKYDLRHLLRSKKLAKEFSDGVCLVFRLCVNNYHRYCYFDDGVQGKNHFINGVLHTVQPVALYSVPVFTENCREFAVMKTRSFGKAIQMEVGAMLVGKINNYNERNYFKRGEEKGCFMYGGSTIILLLKKDSVIIRDRIIEASKQGIETPVRMGQIIGHSTKRTLL